MRTRITLPAAVGLASAALLGAAGSAAATSDDQGTTTANGNGATQSYANSGTHGNQSPQGRLVADSLNKLCLGVPVDANVGALVGLVPVAVQDVNVLSSEQDQQCAENSTQGKGDEALSHLLEDIPVLSTNGAANH